MLGNISVAQAIRCQRILNCTGFITHRGEGWFRQCIICVLMFASLRRITLDTPMNRKYMPDSDFSKWTPLETLAQQMHDWATKGSAMASGSLVKVTTVDGNTDFTVA